MMKRYLIENRLFFDSHLMTLESVGQRSELTANEAELLCLVLDGEASKAAVMARVWTDKGVIVTDSSYHQLTRALRLRLAEHGIAPALLKTLPRHGVRFMGQVRRLEGRDGREALDGRAGAGEPGGPGGPGGPADLESAPEAAPLAPSPAAQRYATPRLTIPGLDRTMRRNAGDEANASHGGSPPTRAEAAWPGPLWRTHERQQRLRVALRSWQAHRIALLLPLTIVTVGSALALSLALSRLPDTEAWLGRVMLLALIGLLMPGTLAGSVNLCRALVGADRVGRLRAHGIRGWRAVQLAGPVATALLAHAGASDPLALLLAIAVGAFTLLLIVTLTHHPSP
ncbi:winged helix-turn-helix domain-containing protein [Chitinasiproducens palmae]|uniref:DNA-binding winged helix-turn-helix (WHTH) domain-containing protein n=1 Tax=Chitinasiproducens palmae TaxID=1770053 RepID=A0A1H2PKK5_9BURK|nr:hypothetical protein [Chitinasiproducens palmae]SDV46921.1 DNA-binding winged helix-turn-helix (wHTH) domain-containing protein [Chitinasiproducens palmae]